MKVSIDQSKCIACGTCVAVCPEVFVMKEDGSVDVKDEYKDKDIPSELESKVIKAKEVCPTAAIVTKE